MRGSRKQADYNAIRARLVESGVEVPEGCELKTDEERALWKTYIRARQADEWREIDLLHVYKAIQIEIKIKEAYAQIERTGEIILNDKGMPIINPWLVVLKSYFSLLSKVLAQIRMAPQEKDLTSINMHGIAQAKQQFTELPLLAN